MRRGELWVARADLYASKTRPVLIVQSDEHLYNSVITCLVTTYENSADRFRIKIKPNERNGLVETSYLMFDKLFSFAREDLVGRIGALEPEEMTIVGSRLKDMLALD